MKNNSQRAAASESTSVPGEAETKSGSFGRRRDDLPPSNLSAVPVLTEPQVSDKIGQLKSGQDCPAWEHVGPSGEALESMKPDLTAGVARPVVKADSRGSAQKLSRREYQCPACGEWVAILTTTNTSDFKCPWCNERLRIEEDENPCRDDSRLVTFRSHWDEPQ